MKSIVSVVLTAAFVLTAATSGVCDDVGESKSLSKALLLSLVLPGAGQQYLGHTGRAKLMVVAEAGVWGTYTGFKIQSKMREDRYKEMAELFAGVQGERSDDYYLALSHYMSSEDFNIDVMREARFRYPDDRDMQLEYFAANGYFGEDAWEWESTEKRLDFRWTRTASRDSDRRAVLTTGFAVLNRVISMIDLYLSFKLGDPGRQASIPRLMVEQRPSEGFRVYVSTPF
jgi:hypothetical protein